MRLIFGLFITTVMLFSCNSNKKIPDVSDIKIDLSTQRFEKDFFKLDSAHLYEQMEQLEAKYPGFGENFAGRILGADPRWSADSTNAYIGSFLNSYKKIYQDAENTVKDFKPYEDQIKKGLQFVKYYFPDYKIPKKIITYIGPVDGYGDALSDDAFLVGLQHHLGKDHPVYKTVLVQESYPEYLTQRFTVDYIAINCMKNILDDIYPQKVDERTLINQMIEKGKRLYLLSCILPDEEEYKLIGYTQQQLKDCYTHEAMIWNLFTKNGYLQVNDKDVIKNYIDESPKTAELGEGSPGNIGSFSGWQIVKKYMQKNSKTTPDQLMKMDNEMIFQDVKYKP